MEIYTIPVGGNPNTERFILYRPLAGLAFVGNRVMADLTWKVVTAHADSAEAPPEEVAFLHRIGFLEPDPPTPDCADMSLAEERFQPTTAVLLLTNQCQLRCTYCYAAAGEFPPQELSVEVGQAAIDCVCETALELGRPYFEVSFHGGGEPTYAWAVLQACTTYARQRALPAKITVTTNGVFSPGQCDWIINNLDSLSLSLDGAPETQDRQRPFVSGVGSSSLVMRTVAELDRHRFPYGIRLTATAPWTQLTNDVRFLCAETACPTIQAEPAFNTVRGGHSQPDVAECRAFTAAFLEAFEIATQCGRRLHYSGARPGVATTQFCSAPYSALIVNARGELVTCYEITGDSHPLASISVIGRLFNGTVQLDEPARRRLHKLMAERRAICRDCFCYWSCAGDCYTRAFGAHAGDHLRRGPRCEINRTLTQGMLLSGLARGGGVWRAVNSRQQTGG